MIFLCTVVVLLAKQIIVIVTFLLPVQAMEADVVILLVLPRPQTDDDSDGNDGDKADDTWKYTLL